MLFVPCHAVARAHRARIEFAAVAVVVAHLHGLGKALGRIATGAGRAGLFGHRIVLHVPRAPVECGLDGDDLVRGRKTHQLRVVHFWRVDDALRAEQIQRVEVTFDLCKRIVDFGAELPADPLAPAQTVAMFAAVSAFVVAHQR